MIKVSPLSFLRLCCCYRVCASFGAHTGISRSLSLSPLSVLSCSIEAGLGHPVYVEETELCRYVFTWRTAAACPVAVTKGRNCLVRDTVDGHTYDLSPLKGKDYNVLTDAFNYTLSLCGPVQNTVCAGDNVGGCQVRRGFVRLWTGWDEGMPAGG